MGVLSTAVRRRHLGHVCPHAFRSSGGMPTARLVDQLPNQCSASWSLALFAILPTLCPTKFSHAPSLHEHRYVLAISRRDLGDQKRLEKDALHLQRSSNKLSPTPRLHTRIWEWMNSAVDSKVGCPLPLTSHSTRKERRAVERKCRAADLLGQTHGTLLKRSS
jgi:hypothetical protein